MIAMVKPMKKEYKVFFFFPFYHIGGAEKVHAQVAQACGGNDCILFFTRRSHNNLFYEEFKRSNCELRDISGFTDIKWLYPLNFIFRGIISGYINRQRSKPVVFNGQCNFGYKISRWIRKDIRQVELIHSFNSFTYIRIPFIPFITRTVMISRKRIEEHRTFYARNKTPLHYLNRIHYICNAILLPAVSQESKSSSAFKVLYVGRGGLEKRIYLITRMASLLKEKDSNIHFEMLGDVSDVINASDHPYITFYGNQSDVSLINNIYAEAHVLILTSDTEGFPMVVIEAMAHGCAILATPVGDIPYHVCNDVNGYLFSSITDEENIVNEGVEYILRMKNDASLFKTISVTNIQHSRDQFGIETFNKAYREVLFSDEMKGGNHE